MLVALASGRRLRAAVAWIGFCHCRERRIPRLVEQAEQAERQGRCPVADFAPQARQGFCGGMGAGRPLLRGGRRTARKVWQRKAEMKKRRD
jgi:hypothetical protein